MRTGTLLMTGLLILAGLPAWASDPVGIYGVVERVVLEGDDSQPERVQLWGWFSTAVPQTRDDYEAPQAGYLYYVADAKTQRVARREWRDLADVAGNGQVVAFASRYEPVGSLRKAHEQPGKPDAYPVAAGITVIEADTQRKYAPIAALREIPLARFPFHADKVEAGEVELKVRNLRGTSHDGARYIFEIADEQSGQRETSEPIEPGETYTTWTPRIEIEAGQSYVWRVRAVDGQWKSRRVETHFQGKTAS
ncbi:MAG: hypothetical protein WD403_02430 [Pirellulales bacterium]